MTLNEVINH